MNSINCTKYNNNVENVENVENLEQIFIIDLINQLENLGGEKNKDDFIKNYARLKEIIEKTDNVLNNEINEINEINQTNKVNKLKDKPNYELYDIQELFNILESNNEYIVEPEKLDIYKFKMLLDVSKILEKKLESEIINITETK